MGFPIGTPPSTRAKQDFVEFFPISVNRALASTFEGKGILSLTRACGARKRSRHSQPHIVGDWLQNLRVSAAFVHKAVYAHYWL